MTGSHAVLAIDQGTSATKAIIVDPIDGVLSSVEVPVRPAYLPDGGVEQEPQALLSSVLESGRRAIAAAGRPVGTVALANQGETVLAWDPASGEPLSAAIGWQDRRAEALCEELHPDRDRVRQRTGLVLDPYFSAPKMAWLRRNVTTEGVVTTTDTWLVHRLTGAFVTDVSTASRSLLLDLDRVDWDPDLIGLFKLDSEPLPRIVACDEAVGTTTAFGAAAVVAGLAVDQQAALLAEGCWEPGLVKCTFGTGSFVLANTGARAVRASNGLTSSVAWRLRGETRYCLDGQVYSVGSAVRWLQDLGLIAAAADLDGVAASDPNGVLFNPALAGLGAPWWRPDATAAFTGMTLSTRAEHLVLAVLQGVAAQIADLTSLIEGELGAPLTRLRVDGGLTRSRVLMQATADLTQIPIDVYPTPHATALGAAALGRLARHDGLTLREAVLDWTPTTSYLPAWSADRTADFRSRWRACVSSGLPARDGA